MSRFKKCRGCVHELFLPVADLVWMQLMPFANNSQGVLLFKNFKNDRSGGPVSV
jgi:hypothetical protein